MKRWLISCLSAAILLGNVVAAQALMHEDKEESGEKKIEKRIVIAVRAEDGKVEILGPGDVAKSIDVEQIIGDKLPAALKFLPRGGEVKIEARAVVIKPDGEKQTIVIEKLGEDGEDVDIRVLKTEDTEAAEHGDDVDLNIWVARNALAGEFMIGVSPAPVSEALKSHLRLEDVGLIITSVFDGTPAKEAGLREYDVLVAVNGEEIEEFSDLVEAVQDAGENEDSLNLKIIRRGKPMTVEVTPAKREKMKGLHAAIERARKLHQQAMSDPQHAADVLRNLHPEIAEMLEKSGNRLLLLHEKHHDADHEDADHDHADHEHADHEHADHDHADHDHADHDHADHDHADHDHADHEHSEHDGVIPELQAQIEELQEAVEELQEAIEELLEDDEEEGDEEVEEEEEEEEEC